MRDSQGRFVSSYDDKFSGLESKHARYAARHPEKKREWLKTEAGKAYRRAVHKRWRQTPAGRAALKRQKQAYRRRWRERYPEKAKAQARRAGVRLRERLATDPVLKESWTRRKQEAALRRSRGISLVEYEAILVHQGGVCRVCEKPAGRRRLHVDHDHRTGFVRGLLCATCNVGLGHFKDSPDLLRKAAHYLETSSNVYRVRMLGAIRRRLARHDMVWVRSGPLPFFAPTSKKKPADAYGEGWIKPRTIA